MRVEGPIQACCCFEIPRVIMNTRMAKVITIISSRCLEFGVYGLAFRVQVSPEAW